MGSNCCKNALDKVRPAPAAHDDASSFDIGGPPDPAAPWPGDTFCRAPAAQAPPVFPEGALDDSLLPEIDELRNQTSAASEVVAMLQQQQQQQRGGFIGRRTSAPAGSGSTAASLPDTQQQQQRTHRIFSLGEPSRRHSPPFGGRGIGEDISSPYSSNPRRGARPTTTTSSATVGENDGCLLDGSTADGSQRLRTRFREALRASSRRLRSRLLRVRTSGSSSSKPGEAGRSNNDSNNEGDKALLSTGATATSFPPDAAIIDDTHFVCYPPASTPPSSSECLSQGWPSAASSPWAEGVPAGDDESATAAASAREVETRGRSTNTSQFISGEGMMTTAPSGRTPTPRLPPFPSGVELNTDVSNDKGQVYAHEIAAEGMRGGREGDGGERKSKTNENRGMNAASAQRQHGSTTTTSTTTRNTGFLKRSRGSNAASSFRRAAVEVVSLPRWRGNNRVSGGGSKNEQKDQGVGTTRPSQGSSSSNSSSSSSKGGDGGSGAQEEEEGKNTLKKRKNLIPPGRQGRFSFKGSRDSKARKNNGADRTAAVRSSHCSSASTAAQEEDDYTAMGVEQWWTTSPSPNQQVAHEYTQPQAATHDFIFSCGSTSSQQPVGANDILRQAQQQQQQPQLASDCAVPLITGQTVRTAGTAGTAAGALRSPQGGPTPTPGAAAAAVGVSYVAGESNHIEHRTTRPSLLDPPLFQHEIHNSRGGGSGDNHLVLLHGDAAGRREQGGESGRQQMQQSVTNDGSINPITASSIGGQETHSNYADHVGHATTNSSNIYMSNYSNSSNSGHSSRSPGTRRTEDDLIPLAAAAAPGSTTSNGANRRGGGGPAWITTETRGIPSPPGGAGLCETTAQQEHTAKDRHQETEEDDTSRGSNNNPHMPVVSMPFPE